MLPQGVTQFIFETYDLKGAVIRNTVPFSYTPSGLQWSDAIFNTFWNSSVLAYQSPPPYL